MGLLELGQTAIALMRTPGTLAPRVLGAVIKAAIAIQSEDPATENHEKRKTWAVRVSAHKVQQADLMLSFLLEDSQVVAVIESGAAITDAQIQAKVDASVNTVIAR